MVLDRRWFMGCGMRSWAPLGLSLLVSVADAAPGDANAGKVKSQLCQSCHGANGVSIAPDIPNLAGQYFEYLFKQIQEFQIQNRNDVRMSPIANSLTTMQDISDIAAYFAAQPTMQGKASKSDQTILGKKIFENGLPERGLEACAGCHGMKGKGLSKGNPQFPVIGGQHKQYILKQLNDFKTNKRMTDPTDFMTNVGKILNKGELDAVAEYVSGL